MKKNIWIILMFLNCFGYAQVHVSTSIVKALMKDMFFEKISSEILSQRYFFTVPGTKRDSIMNGVFNYVRKNDSAKFSPGFKLSNLVVRPYSNNEKLKGYQTFYSPENNQMIFEVVKDDTVLYYVLLQDGNIVSFVTLGKGQKDKSYFVIF